VSSDLKENNLEAGQITPSGKNGRVLKEDVLRFLAGEPAAPPAVSGSGPPASGGVTDVGVPVAAIVVPARAAADTVVPIRGLQRSMVWCSVLPVLIHFFM
jgi:pyruvate/2-oxoglutarate dehydrogenase complex dihydrolipoamide acyltransferase (E2) component